MTPEQQKLNVWYTYLYKNKTWKHLNDWRIQIFKDEGLEEERAFVKRVNYIKRCKFLE